ncbi:MAG TPA: GNAT family N-acetyltransferase [Flavisolibacter sp.]|nr:GNAT family N-acetyltransferase [Flavisolibacter sp.]
MFLLALAIAPGLAICLYIFSRDRHDPEPPAILVMSFILGMLATVPAVFLEFMTQSIDNRSVPGILLTSFLFVAFAEELCKFLALRFYAFNRRSFDEPLDGIVYSVMISMGFATLENIAYVLLDKTGEGLHIALTRMVTSVPAHATFGVIMGYYTGKAKFDFLKRRSLLAKGLAGATVAHGLYDSFLFLNQVNWIRKYIPPTVANLLVFSGAMLSLFICISLSRRLIRMHRLTSQQLFMHPPVLTIRYASAEDISLIRSLALQIWPQTYAHILSQQQITYMLDRMYSESALQHQMEQQHQFIIVYNAGIPVGFASYNQIEPGIFKLQKIYVLTKQQGKGTGRFIIDQVIRDIKPQGATALQLNVNRYNEAKNFYEKLGFKVIREEDIDIGNNFFMNDYVMSLSL